MGEIKNNWYLILELEYAPNPVTDEAVIDAKIEEKKRYWSGHFNDMRHGAEYRTYVQMLPQIKSDMHDPQIRQRMIADACAQFYQKIDPILKQLGMTEIPKDTIEAIAKKVKESPDVVEKRAKELGYKIAAAKHADAQKIFDQYYMKGPEHADRYNQDKNQLESLGFKNLYEFLAQNMEVTPREMAGNDCSSLCDRAKVLSSTLYTRNDSTSSAGSKLASRCLEAFQNESEKKLYDDYLAFSQTKAVLDRVSELYSFNADMEGAMSNATDQLTQIVKDRKLAKKILASFCIVRKIPFHEQSDSEEKDITICRCGCINHVPQGQQGFCTNCGRSLLMKCPKCGSLNPNSVHACAKCGFVYDNVDKADGACAMAEDCLAKMNFEAASMQLDNAESYWPGYDRAQKLRERLQAMQKQLGDISAQMANACRGKKYYEAKQLFEKIRTYSPSYRNESAEAEITAAIGEAEKYKQLAKSSAGEEAIIDACTKAYEAASDCPGIAQIMGSHKPAAPVSLQISANPANNVNVIAWSPAPGKAIGTIYYLVRRREGARPISASDGDLVGRVSGTSVNDMNISPGVEYYYAVYAERAGITSEKGLLSAQPVVNLFEISHAAAAAGDKSVALSWEMPPENATPEVVRIANGKKETIPVANMTGVLDKDLVNDQPVSYHICLSYHIGMKTLRTPGVDLTATPTKPPLPIEHVVINPAENGVYKLAFENPENAKVQFYYAKKRPDYLVGDLIPVSDLERSMKELQLQRTGDNEGTFRYTGDDTIYILAVVIQQGSAVAGSIVRASRGGAVKIESVFRANGKIILKTNMPKECTGFIVLYRHDHLPEDLGDKKASRKFISKRQFEYDNALSFDDDRKGPYYITVFAEFRRVGEDTDYSDGTDCELSDPKQKTTIFYTIDVRKKLFGKPEISITFHANTDTFVLPDIDVMSAVGAAPVFHHSAVLYQTIQGCEIKGSKKVALVPKSCAKNTYVKPFLSDEDRDKDRYSLKLEGQLSAIN